MENHGTHATRHHQRPHLCLLAVIAVVLVGWALHAMAVVFVPIVCSVFVALLAFPVDRWVAERIGRERMRRRSERLPSGATGSERAHDVIHGRSPHHVKAVEVYRGKPIRYGCGDFITDYEGISGHEEFRGDIALAYLPTFSRPANTLVDFRLVAFRMRRFRLESLPREDALWLGGALERERQVRHRRPVVGRRRVLGRSGVGPAEGFGCDLVAISAKNTSRPKQLRKPAWYHLQTWAAGTRVAVKPARRGTARRRQP